MDSLDSQTTAPKSRVRYWKKVILQELARQLYPDGDIFSEPRIFGGEIDPDIDQESFESACYELQHEFSRRSR